MSDEVDEYETEAQAAERIARLRAESGQHVALGMPIEAEDIGEIIEEYCAFNQAEYFEPLFESGEIHSSMRHMVDEPLHVSNNLRSAVRFMDLRNDERALDDKMGKYGPVVVRWRTIVRSPYREVSYDDIDQARGR